MALNDRTTVQNTVLAEKVLQMAHFVSHWNNNLKILQSWVNSPALPTVGLKDVVVAFDHLNDELLGIVQELDPELLEDLEDEDEDE